MELALGCTAMKLAPQLKNWVEHPRHRGAQEERKKKEDNLGREKGGQPDLRHYLF